MLNTMLARMKKSVLLLSRAITDKPMELSNRFKLISMRIAIKSFIMLDIMDKVPAIQGEP